MKRPHPAIPPGRILAAAAVLAAACGLLFAFEHRVSAGTWLDAHRWKKDTPGGELLLFLTAVFDGAALAWIVLAVYAAGGSGRTAARALLALVLAGLLGYLLKEGILRARPNRADLDSFPSGHTAGTMAVMASLAGRRLRLWVPLMLVVALAAFTRIGLGKHFPSDVVGGAALGLLSVVLAGWIPFPEGVRIRRTHVLLVLLLALPLFARGGDRWRDFFLGAAPGAWLVAAALGARSRLRTAEEGE